MLVVHMHLRPNIMDPASAIGVASAVLAIISTISKSITSLSDLQSRYHAADLKVNLLIVQLSTVRAALKQMARLMESDVGAPKDPELVEDISTCLGCVEAVVMILDDKVSLIEWNKANELTTRSKVNFIWDEKTMDDYSNMLNNQIHALNLLLTAFQCESRQVFERIKDETSSLLWLRDAESIQTYRSAGTQDLGTVNATFAFDSEIFNSRVYQVATRSNMIRALLTDKRDVPDEVASRASTRGQYLAWSHVPTAHEDSLGPLMRRGDLSRDKQLPYFQRFKYAYETHEPGDIPVGRPRNFDIKVLVLGISDSGKSTLQKSMKMAFLDDDVPWRRCHKPAVYLSLVQNLKALASKTVQHAQANNIDLYNSYPENEADFTKCYQLIDEWLHKEAGGVSPRYSFPQSVGSAVLYLSANEDIRAMHDRLILDPKTQDRDRDVADSTKFFMSSASRIVDPLYIPTCQDVLWTRNMSLGLHEFHYLLDGTLCQFFDVGGTRAERRKWPLEYSSVNSIIFTFDVSCYNQTLFEDSTTNRMTEQLRVWDMLVTLPCFSDTNFIVLFTKIDKVTPSTLEASPFNSLFPDYSDKPHSSEDILQYLACRLDVALRGEGRTRRLVFCNAGSIWNSPTNMAEVAVNALNKVELLYSSDL
ncbi:hypothetical protein J7T55_000940 [Diaporthe amygdali]|uniref:uncharacterized protein n=1 Tax=Phomopsis amygdali TaxID=1214568 RepID=UPI0022FF26A6|nr:uncharacterized protein J7T55_000940 [Diaporthe amygdali]KAJ0120087.1 hypothetical protein J7T55_000940 [Diaporthe amygdali]